MADTVDQLLSEAAQHRSAGRFDAAAAIYRRAIAGAPHAAPPLLLLGQLRLQQGNHAEAAELIGGALALDPQIAGGATALGVAQSNLDQLDAAIASFTRAVTRDPRDLQALTSLGILLSIDERPAEAVPYYQRAIELAPHDAELHNGLGVALLELERVDAAVAALRRAVALAPEAAEPHNNLGLALAKRGQAADAAGSFRRAVDLQPDYADALLNLAQALHQSGELEAAAAAYRKLVAATPNLTAGHFALGMILAALRRPAEAIRCFERVLSLQPGQTEAHLHLAAVLQAVGQLDAAVAHCNLAIEQRPGLAAAHVGLANALRAQGKLEEAIERYRHVLAIAPDHAVAQANLGLALAERGQLDDAIAAYQRALALAPDLVEAHHGLARALRNAGHYAAALEHLDRVLALRADLAEAHADKGNVLKEMGQFAAARRALEAAIALQPEQPEFYHNLAECMRFTEGDPYLAAMEAMADRAETLSDAGRTALHFALGKAYADIGDSARSFAAFLAGNALKRQQTDYDEATTLAVLAHVRTVFTSALLQTHQGAGNPSRVPIFIVGMPRSGSTLVEQILASHPEVHGAGESPAFHDAVARLAENAGHPVAYPAIAHELTDADLAELGRRYLETLRGGAPSVARITDKMLGNFRFLGLIQLALPNARIIHTRRDPVDTCLSCFSKLFGGNLPYTYDLGELGRYYRAYARLMAHWRQVLPQAVMLEIDYEDVVADLETAARRIVAHCGLPWDARCLEFHSNDRPVRTSSLAQVRQPIYRGSIGRWRPYAPLLRPLLEALGSA